MHVQSGRLHTFGIIVSESGSSSVSSLTCSEARRIVLDAGQVQVMVSSLQVLIHAVSLAVLLCVVVTVMTPKTTKTHTHL